ncbi:MAG TPA: rhodanese-like domain-containing protein [Thermomicrobiales bacterium]|nr:rhodanese-like domain-containing protein [Thermomicrobiales bacterium]
MDGGRAKWESEGRSYTQETSAYAPTTYRASEPDLSVRAFRDQVLAQMQAQRPMIDVRAPEEFSGELLAPAHLSQEAAQRSGHIPGATNIPWGTAANTDGTFKSADELREIYGGRGITADQPVITYCRIGERAAHTWFALRYLLGYPDVRNYDGSWTEWGSLVRAPIERTHVATTS